MGHLLNAVGVVNDTKRNRGTDVSMRGWKQIAFGN